MRWRSSLLVILVFGLCFSLTWGGRKLLRFASTHLRTEEVQNTQVIQGLAFTAPMDEALTPGLIKHQTENEAANTGGQNLFIDAQKTWLEQALKNIPTGGGEYLFTFLFSADFRREENWQRLLPLIAKRLSSGLPRTATSKSAASHGAYSAFDNENRDRMGLLKALGKVEVSEASGKILKNFLLGFLESRVQKTWLLEREAMSALFQKFNLSEDEKLKILGKLDPRAIGLATKGDGEILREAVDGAAL